MKRDEKVHVSYLEIFASRNNKKPPEKKHILKILIEKTYNQPLTKTKKTRDEKF